MRLTLTPSERAVICELAASEGISASIVVGRLGREEQGRRALAGNDSPAEGRQLTDDPGRL
jgi:hypothetical protein